MIRKNMLIKIVISILCLVQVRADQVLPYTIVAYTTSGAPCIGGCSPTTHQCVASWPPSNSPCVLHNTPANRFRVISSSTHKYCLSNCGKYAWSTAWCYVEANGQYAYCDESGEPNTSLSLSPTTTNNVQVLPYTVVAYTTSGAPCIGGCSPTTHQCVASWPPSNSPCVLHNTPANRFRVISTSSHKYCLSNCGKYAWSTAWCYVEASGQYAYCDESGEPNTSLIVHSGESNTLPLSTVTTTKPQTLPSLTTTTAKPDPAVTENAPKIPVLPRIYTTKAESQKGNCDSFFRKLSNDLTEWNQPTTPYDGFIKEKADIYDRIAKSNSDGEVKHINEQGVSVNSYTLMNLVLTNGRNSSIPTVIRAHVTNHTLKHYDVTDRLGEVSEDSEMYDVFYSRRLIGIDIGGTTGSYNIAPLSGLLRNVLTNIEQVIRSWCIDGEESVDIVMVVFYPDFPTRMPHAIGLDLTFNNRDRSVFVHCKDSLYFNLI